MIKERSGSDEPRYAVPETIKESEYCTVADAQAAVVKQADQPIAPFRSQGLNVARNSYVPPQYC